MAAELGQIDWMVSTLLPLITERGAACDLDPQLKAEAERALWSWEDRPRLDTFLQPFRRFLGLPPPLGAGEKPSRAVLAWISILETRDARTLAGEVSGGSPEESKAGKAFAELARELGLPPSPDKFRPAEMVAKIKEAGGRALYASASAFMMQLRNKGSSLPSLAAGLRAWAAFCDALGEPHFPVSAERMAQFSGVFREHGTYCAYVAHVASACSLLGLPAGWSADPRIEKAKGGIRKARFVFKGPRLSVPANVMATLCVEGYWSPERFFCALSWVFLLRARSEATGLIRDPDTSLVADLHSPLPDGVDGVIGMAGGALVIRLKARKAHIFGDVVTRGCRCRQLSGPDSHLSGGCPTHRLWGWVVSRARPGERLFRDGIADSAVLWLRLALAHKGVARASEFGLHSLRRGAAQELADTGSDLATILKAGSWRSSAFRAYLNLVGVEDKLVAPTLSSLVDMDADEE